MTRSNKTGRQCALAAAGFLAGAVQLWSGALTPAAAAETAAARPATVSPGVQVDWTREVLIAAGSCAADLYAASAEVARVKAERLARMRAEARLRRALQAMSREPRLRGKLSPEVLTQLDPARAKVAHIEYAATGSVSLRLELPLHKSAAPPAPPPPAGSGPGDGGTPAAEGDSSP